jgi:hypothetical protein
MIPLLWPGAPPQPPPLQCLPTPAGIVDPSPRPFDRLPTPAHSCRHRMTPCRPACSTSDRPDRFGDRSWRPARAARWQYGTTAAAELLKAAATQACAFAARMTACRLVTRYTVRQNTDSAGQHTDASSCNLFWYSLGSKDHSHKRFVLLLVILSELRRMSREGYGLLEVAGKQGLQRPVNLHLRRAAGQHPALCAHCCAGQHLSVLPVDHC